MKSVSPVVIWILIILPFGCGKHEQGAPKEVLEFRKPRPTAPQQEVSIEEQIFNVIIAGDESALRALVPSRFGVNDIIRGKPSLWLAVENGRASLVQVLIELGADVNYRNSEGLSLSELATQKGYRRIYWLLRPEETRELTRNLQSAIESQSFSTIRRVLEQEFDINFHFEDGTTPLTKTIRTQCLRCLQVMLNAKYRVDPEMPERSGQTPLTLAEESRVERIIEFIQVAIERVRDERQGGTP